MAKKIELYNQEDIDRLVQNEILNLPPNFNENELYSALMDNKHFLLNEYDDELEEFFHFLMQPENFYYTCKWLLNIQLFPFQCMILREMWNRKFPMLIATRGGGKSFLLGLYSILRALFTQGSKIVIVGAAFRQSKIIFEFMETVWKNAPILRHIIKMTSGQRVGPRRDIDRCTFSIGESEATAIPIGTGQKIRGLRAHYTVCDEFDALNKEIFEVVIRGFGSVSSSPMEKAKNSARIKILKSLGMYVEADEIERGMGFGNQIVISGTAGYGFSHFYEYWQRYRDIINSGGDKHKLEEIFQGDIPENFSWKDFSIFRIPYTILPDMLMDKTAIAGSEAVMNKSLFDMEYNSIFISDSGGFFPRSLIESCVCKNPINLPSGPIHFSAQTRGNKEFKYVYGIDPASEQDNFAIVVLEVHPDHSRIVYCWTIKREDLRKRRAKDGSGRQSFYNYCAKKIRKLMNVFPTEYIGIDSQGGGIGIIEALQDENLLEGGELPVWPYVKKGDNDPLWWEKDNKDTDGQPGIHNLCVAEFSNARFTAEANHGLKKDFEQKTCIFPFFDSATIAESISLDKISGREYDTLEDCVMEIEELKDELTTVIHTRTTAGRDKWDTPDVKLPGHKKGRLRKDRYSALVIANMIARSIQNSENIQEHNFVGGYVGQKASGVGGRMYVGPDHIVSKMNEFKGYGVIRRKLR